MRFQKVSLIGVGLLGGSLGQALKARGLAGRVTGLVRRQASVTEAVERGAVDEATLDPETAVRGADLVVFCTPVGRMKELADRVLPFLEPNVIATDVGSAKAALVRELEGLFAAVEGTFVGSHPMAGSEQTGVAHARPDLFEGATCVVTPTEKTSKMAVARIEALWRGVGGRTVRLSPEKHDELVTWSSHLPHMVAALLVVSALQPGAAPEQRELCASGFRDTTRVASGSVEMWRDIIMQNKEHLAAALEQFAGSLDAVRRGVEAGDREVVAQLLRVAKEQRDAWLASRGWGGESGSESN